MMKPPHLSISVVLYKTPVAHIEKFITSLCHVKILFHVYFVDNSPTDFLRTFCVNNLSSEYIHLPSNPGFGSAHNLAIRLSRGIESCYHLVINADVHFNYDIISEMLDYMSEHPDVGQMMPKVLNLDGSVQRLCKLVPTPMDLLIRRFLPARFKKAKNRIFEMHDSGYDKIMFVPYLSGCFMLFRQQALLEVGIFDERFFMYPEDIDLTRRVALKFDTIFFPQVQVYHEHGAASYKSFRMLVIHSFNIVKYFNKWGWFYDPERSKLNERAISQLSKFG
jgi:GT2 family glycosyltransferase